MTCILHLADKLAEGWDCAPGQRTARDGRGVRQMMHCQRPPATAQQIGAALLTLAMISILTVALLYHPRCSWTHADGDGCA
jgi:hypothetical protein